jgi:hypothetical protein
MSSFTAINAAAAAPASAPAPALAPPPPLAPPALPTMPALPPKATGAMTALSALVIVRNPDLRLDRTLNTTRPSNLEALLGQTVGQVNAVQCGHCQAGSGLWTECVSVAGFFSGSCANCHYGSEGARCSLRKYSITISWLFTDYN